MAGVNNQELVGENIPLNPSHHQQDGMEASVTPEGSASQAQVTPLDVPPLQHVPAQEDPLVVPHVPLGAPMEVVMDALNRRIQAVENSCAASKISRSTRRHRSPIPENTRSRSRSRSPRPAPRRNTERPLSSTREHPQWNNRSPPPRNNRTPPLRNNRSPPQRNNRSPPRNGDAVYDGTTDPDEHIQSVETALDYSSLRGSIKCSIDSWDELCRMFKAHFTTSRRHPKTVASLKAIIQGPEEPLRSYIERFNKVVVEVEDGLRGGTKFQEAFGIMEMKTLDEFFELAQRYIKWEEKHIASEYVDGQPRTGNNPPQQAQLAIEASTPKQNVEEDNRVVGGVALAISRPEDFLPLPNNEEKETLDYLSAHLDGSWKNFPGALVISGGGFNLVTIGSIKRKFDELEKASLVGEIKITEVKESSVPLTFYREEVPGGWPNFQIPLLVRAKMANFDIRRILVDQGSSCDIMYSGLFKVLQLTEEILVPYVGSDLRGFHGSTTKPWGYVDLIVTFGENKAMKSVKVKFLVVDCPSLYSCIIGRPTLAELRTINGDIEAAWRCFEAASKNLNSVVTPKKKKEEAKLSGVNSINTEDAVELDARTSKKERKQEKKAMKDDLLIKENYRPILDGEFELVSLGEDPTKGIKIGADLPDLVKRQLKACLRENDELFAWSATEMPGIDPEVACHQLTINPRASAVVQRRRKQSPEKAEAAKKAVKDLLEANSLLKPNLNRACPKDAYHLPNIDKLVDNSSGFKLLSFMDAYSGYNQIKMAEIDEKKTAFMTETGNYYYNVMHFGLKNAVATYQRMMNKVFHNEIGDMLEVYMDDMIVKSEEEIDHTIHLKKVFDQARKFNMRFNPEKCTFGVKAGKFLGFYLTERGIEANPDKCRAFFEYSTPKSKKSIQTLNECLPQWHDSSPN
ncbi:hypothetical protein TSUD_140980 [Trifolium subterraneum]|uniref:Reverse transcriptase domain-containing protein n=1 Tax=Trifolium subterraneum TaxID=3900 RepID=A0A2Z6P2V5_TRISU|nr:hypothetical protein TSUD_140980 [Trifolium subterraneum]